ncbi:SAM-dependent methyltransferase [Spirillospora sp. NPDC047279]|uniref:SAM-dependent methyltransferase n=1 Tax=Spirillospora sp. NPDC047279 TaxID=3155478 RepID=UPI0033EF7776
MLTPSKPPCATAARNTSAPSPALGEASMPPRKHDSANPVDRAATGSDSIDASVPNAARVWNYLLGGKDFFPADEQAGEQMIDACPTIAEAVQANRDFLGRVVTFMAGAAGIRQFLEVGPGLPAFLWNNTHHVAQNIAPAARVVYVDNDPFVLACARALLTSKPEGAVDYVNADLRHPDAVLNAAAVTLDFDQPIGLILLGVLHYVPDDAIVCGILTTLADRLPSGSMAAISWAAVSTPPVNGLQAALRVLQDLGGPAITTRTPQTLERHVTDAGLQLLDPGVVPCTWRPELDLAQTPAAALCCCVARKSPKR